MEMPSTQVTNFNLAEKLASESLEQRRFQYVNADYFMMISNIFLVHVSLLYCSVISRCLAASGFSELLYNFFSSIFDVIVILKYLN